VTASATGFLDAWVDFNQDGDWNDAGEQIFTSEPLVAGENPFAVTVAGTAKPGAAAARFRFSSKGGLTPTGFAEDGEVEDYRITITGNPWRNPADGLDVDGSGFVVPQDALIVINALNSGRGGPLPSTPVPPFTPPPFLDANGDTFLSPLDVLAIINFLNNRAAAAAGGEGEGAGSFAAAPPDSQGIVSSPSESAAGDAAGMFASGVLFVDHRLHESDSAEEADSSAAWEWVDETEQAVIDVASSGAHYADDDSPELATALSTANQDLDESHGDLLDLLAGDIDQARRLLS
jgi:hypothetical protein